eukprot:5161128-Amphidinium_carterae.1
MVGSRTTTLTDRLGGSSNRTVSYGSTTRQALKELGVPALGPKPKGATSAAKGTNGTSHVPRANTGRPGRTSRPSPPKERDGATVRGS